MVAHNTFGRLEHVKPVTRTNVKTTEHCFDATSPDNSAVLEVQ